MIDQLLAQHLRFHLEPKVALHMPACLRATCRQPSRGTHRQAYNKGSTRRLTPEGNVIRGGFGGTFRLSAGAQAGLFADRQSGSCVTEIGSRREALGNS